MAERHHAIHDADDHSYEPEEFAEQLEGMAPDGVRKIMRDDLVRLLA